MKIFNFTKILLVSILFFSFTTSVLGAEGKVYFRTSTKEVSLNQEFSVDVMLNVDEPINAFLIEVDYPKNVQFVSSDNSGSIVELWQNSPRIGENGNIVLSGGLFRAFKGNGGLVLKLIFKAISEGETKIIFNKSDLFLADGKGTVLRADTEPISLTISKNAVSPLPASNDSISDEINEIKLSDLTPPELELKLAKSPVEDVVLLSFNALDRESGIKSTEMRFKKWFKFSSWIKVGNPVKYPPGAWRVELKATNGAGLRSIEGYTDSSQFFVKILSPFILLGIIFSLVYNIKKRRK
ncbi:hypothetical protein A2914_01250 [Candidatus Nomurabacteria bacterium RIFCSPLOWO2_01_FULL_41_21]|uniref:Cohesin domain-containing protein n=2 Tax=Candidatus Nomuraibacteriota TaxID=1752729 RepID=A0A1F6V2X2_9BACT|nr:MAG: hypothetical protein A2733_02340 [Candidatus Nomurabacteria bacterium RIFCSPHIGHO2_01_FULL_40_20]OGI87938.1 MAG: hypothetical protein A2914_01250 [Candidatus Nomurabacteria bacterium RIFCSPLOWO2_01_FULL_41_21]